MPAVLNNDDDNNSRSNLKKAQHPSRRVVGQKLCLIVLMSVLPSVCCPLVFVKKPSIKKLLTQFLYCRDKILILAQEAMGPDCY
ncbi:hypothetical protein T01_8989 [Trichinella spiralis]|uniref:Uncharacterized protein n=1 Tax=Trichinella spiralis TaxID=6334 RepID=A0A0V1BLQ5_TRISP|nr:hypothetical protein T01_8989 [Trichinella spiralis]